MPAWPGLWRATPRGRPCERCNGATPRRQAQAPDCPHHRRQRPDRRQPRARVARARRSRSRPGAPDEQPRRAARAAGRARGRRCHRRRRRAARRGHRLRLCLPCGDALHVCAHGRAPNHRPRRHHPRAARGARCQGQACRRHVVVRRVRLQQRSNGARRDLRCRSGSRRERLCARQSGARRTCDRTRAAVGPRRGARLPDDVGRAVCHGAGAEPCGDRVLLERPVSPDVSRRLQHRRRPRCGARPLARRAARHARRALPARG